MSFLYPFYLWALAGISVPLLIHLFGKKKGKIVNFPTVRFLKISQSQTGRIRKLEEILILLLRTLLLTLLIMILAGPVSKNRSPFLKEQFIIFIMDDSFSMNASETGLSSFESLKKASVEVLSFIKKPSRVSLIYLSGKQHPFSHNYAETAEAIKKSEPSYQTGRFEPAIEKAMKSLEGITGRGEKRIFLFTDMQNILWENFSGDALKKKDIKLSIFDLSQGNTENLSFKNMYIIPGRNTAVAEIKNWGNKKSDVEVKVYGDRWERRKTTTLKEGSTELLIFEIPEENEKIYGEINHKDILLTDNHFYFSFKGTGSLKKILLVSEDEDSSFYVKKAIEVVSEQGKTEIVYKKPSEIKALFLKEYQTIFIVNTGRIDEETVKKIYSYLNDGGSLIYFPGERVTYKNFNDDWQMKEENIFLMPGHIKGEKTGFKNIQNISFVETSHPLFTPFRGTIFEYIKTITFKQLFTVEEITGTVLLKTNSGAPLLIEKKVGKGTVLFFTFLTDKDWTNLHTRPFFPVMTESILNYLSGRESEKITAGEKVKTDVPDGAERIEICSPDGATQTIKNFSSSDVEFLADKPGFWKVETYHRTGDIQKTLSVNVDWEEGDLKKNSITEIREKMSGVKVEILKGDEATKTMVKKSRTSELSQGLLNIILLIFIAEITVSNLLHYKKLGKE